MAHGWIDFVDVEGDEVVSPFGFRLSSASLLHVAGQEGGLSQRPGAVLVFLNDSPFQCFISPFETEILTRRVRKKNGTDYQVLDVANSGDGLVGRVAGHHLDPGDHVLTLKLVHPGSVSYDVDRRQVWIEHEELQLMGIESEPRRVRASDMVRQKRCLSHGSCAHVLFDAFPGLDADEAFLSVRRATLVITTPPPDNANAGVQTQTRT